MISDLLPQKLLLLQREPHDLHLHPVVAGHLSVSGISGEHLQAKVKELYFI